MKHKTLWILIAWLAFLAGSIALQAVTGPQLPTTVIVNLAGYITLAYVGISKAANIVKALKAPAGEFGFEYVAPIKDRLLWITIVWLLFIVEVLIVRALVPDGTALPVEEVIGFAGTLSAVYVGMNKGEQVAAASGKTTEDEA